MSVKLSPVFNGQEVDANGDPAVGYKLFAYAAGSSTKQTTYTDDDGTVPQTNPIILDSLGYPTNGPIWLTAGQSYKFVLAPPTDTDPPTSPIKTIDGVTGVNDSATSITQFQSSGVTPTYISPMSFSLAGDQTSDFHVGRRVRATVNSGAVYGTIDTTSYTSITTVTLTMDGSQVLDSGLSAIDLSLLRADHLATPFANVAETILGVKTFTSSPVVPDATQINEAVSLGQLGAVGQCRLGKSGANILLSPLNGNKLTIDGIQETVPSSGVTLAPTGLTPSTLYYIYAYMSSGVMTLEASATTHVTDTTTGVEIKSGDSTRTLVGMGYPITGPAWQDTQAQRFVASYFNRTTVSSSAAFTASRSTASATYVELNAEIRNEFLIWSDDVALISATGRVQGGANTICITSIGIDSITAEDTYSVGQAYVANAATPVAASIAKAGLSEGYHYATLLGEVVAGTATWIGSASVGNRTVLSTVIQ